MRALRNTAAVIAAVVTLGGAAFWVFVRPWWKGWGVDPAEAARPLPGDDVVAHPTVEETRGITIDAPPATVWPWLVQMGFGRAGWYSYDMIDMKGKSAREIDPALQSIAVGELMPTHPGGGFRIRVVEPERALVLYMDNASMVMPDEVAGAGVSAEGTAAVEATPVNLKAAGAILGNAQPSEFAGTWAFVLEPAGAGRTRLIERFRIEFAGGDKPWTKVTMPFMGFGVFAMVRKQLIGIKARAEQA